MKTQQASLHPEEQKLLNFIHAYPDTRLAAAYRLGRKLTHIDLDPYLLKDNPNSLPPVPLSL